MSSPLEKTTKDKIKEDSDFIDSPKFNNSLAELLHKYPDGAPDGLICKVLHLDTKQLDRLYKSAILKLRSYLGKNGT